MLSRVAENLYWIGRYIERAENTARLLDVNYFATLEGAGVVTGQWAPLLVITGSDEAFRAKGGRGDAKSITHWLAFDPSNPSSIRTCLQQARENARGLRDRLSTEMWEAINKAYHDLCFNTERVLETDDLHTYCCAVRDASHLFHGIAAATLLHDQGWEFLRTGQMLERGDNVLRLLKVRYRRSGGQIFAEAFENHRWMAVLKSASAYEAYRKRHHTRLEPRRIAEFLLLEPKFPRSVVYCATRLRSSLKAIDEHNREGDGEAGRLAGWMAARLEYATVEKILEREERGLQIFLDDFANIGTAIFEAYFAS
jgi:uncharacterized alpha-E superfamily protein